MQDISKTTPWITARSLILTALMMLSSLTAMMATFNEPELLSDDVLLFVTGYEDIIAGTDYTTYETWDTVNATTDSYDLTNGSDYSISWTLSVGAMQVDYGHRNWTAMNNWSYEDYYFSGLTVGWHCFNADLYETYANGTSTYLDSDNACFDVINSSTGGMSEYIIAGVGQTMYNVGDIMSATTDSFDLFNGTDYSIYWWVNDTSNGNWVDVGIQNWTSTNSWSHEDMNISGLAAGYYCFNAELSLVNATGTWLLDSDYDCFDVVNGSTGGMSEYIIAGVGQTMYNVGDIMSATTDSFDLFNGSDYSVYWWVNDTSNGNWVNGGMQNWTSTNSWSHEDMNISGLAAGYYCFNAELSLVNATGAWLLDSDNACFGVVNGSTGGMSEYIIAGVGQTMYNVGDIMSATTDSFDLVNGSDYSVYWWVNDTSNGNWVNGGMQNWTSTNSWSHEDMNISGLAAGYYCFNADLELVNATGTWPLDSDNACFVVVNGSTGGGNEWIVAGTDYTTYYPSDTVNATTDSYGLNNGSDYWITWSLFLGTQVDYGHRNWTAMNNWSHEDYNFSGLTAGSYCFNANLYEMVANGTMAYLSSDNACFNVITNSTGGMSEYIIAGVGQTMYNVSDIMSATTDSFDLFNGSDYSVYWWVNDTSNGNWVNGGMQNWTSTNSWSHEDMNISGLAAGYYCFNAELSLVNATGAWLLDSDNACFVVNNGSTGGNDDDGDGVMNSVDLCPNTPTSETVDADGCSQSQLDDDGDGVMNNLDLCPNTPTSETVDADGCSQSQLEWIITGTNYTTYYTSDSVTATTDSYNLNIGSDYSIWWNLSNGVMTIDTGYHNWTAMNNWSHEDYNFSGLAQGSYYFDGGLSLVGAGAAWELDWDSCQFEVIGESTDPSIDLFVYNYNIWTGTSAEIDIEVSNLTIDQSYVMEWNLHGGNGTNITGSYNWTAYSTSSSETWDSGSEVGELTAGTYCLDVYFITFNSWESDCFTVTYGESSPYIIVSNTMNNGTFDLTNDSNGEIRISINSYNLTYGENYSVYWSLNNGSYTTSYTGNNSDADGDGFPDWCEQDWGTDQYDPVDFPPQKSYYYCDGSSGLPPSSYDIQSGDYSFNGINGGVSDSIVFTNLDVGTYCLNADLITTNPENVGVEGFDEYCFAVIDNTDSDGDGVIDDMDIFPNDSNEWNDTDMDGVGDNSDVFPTNASEWSDSDSDGFGDNSDAYPQNAAEWADSDSDGFGDNSDAFPYDSNEWNDTDMDGLGDNIDDCIYDADNDADGDGICGDVDICPFDDDDDADDDGICGDVDVCPNDATNTCVDDGIVMPEDCAANETYQTNAAGVGECVETIVMPDTAPTCWVGYWVGSAGTPQNNWNWTEMMAGWNEFDAPDNGEFTLALPKGDYYVYFGCWDAQEDDITLAVAGLPDIQEFEADESWVWGWDEFSITDDEVGNQHDMVITWSSTDFGGNVTIHFKGVETVADSVAESDTGGLPGFPASLALVSLLGAAVILSRRED